MVFASLLQFKEFIRFRCVTQCHDQQWPFDEYFPTCSAHLINLQGLVVVSYLSCGKPLQGVLSFYTYGKLHP